MLAPVTPPPMITTSAVSVMAPPGHLRPTDGAHLGGPRRLRTSAGCGCAARIARERDKRLCGVADELDRLLALQGVGRDDPGALAGGAGDIACRLRARDREGEAAADCAEDAEARLHRSVDERAEHAAGPVRDFLRSTAA